MSRPRTTLPPSDSSLHLTDFEPLGEFAAAGQRATALALERSQRCHGERRIPIAGAAVLLTPQGQLETVTVGHNGRIPTPDPDDFGYPTDHGETAAIRQIPDVGALDWHRIVFATTLSPCIMCYRTLRHLHALGLDKVVIAEAQTYPGTATRLAALPDMTLVELGNPDGVRTMENFARTYPWDWAADIGEVPPARSAWTGNLADAPDERRRVLAAVSARLENDTGYTAGIVSAAGEILSATTDQRAESGGNPTHSAPMLAMGEAGSAVNLRECVLVFAAADRRRPISVADFGLSSLGACELFRPAAILSNVGFDTELAALLDAARVRTTVET